MWGRLQHKVNLAAPTTADGLKVAFLDAVAALDLEEVRCAIAQWVWRPRCCKASEGRAFGHKLKRFIMLAQAPAAAQVEDGAGGAQEDAQEDVAVDENEVAALVTELAGPQN